MPLAGWPCPVLQFVRAGAASVAGLELAPTAQQAAREYLAGALSAEEQAKAQARDRRQGALWMGWAPRFRLPRRCFARAAIEQTVPSRLLGSSSVAGLAWGCLKSQLQTPHACLSLSPAAGACRRLFQVGLPLWPAL